jgi:hypothetical protein
VSIPLHHDFNSANLPPPEVDEAIILPVKDEGSTARANSLTSQQKDKSTLAISETGLLVALS